MVTKEMSKNLPTVQECPEMGYLRDYVQADDDTRYANLANGNLRLDVSHSNLVQRWHDILFHHDMTVMQCKEKLYRHGGTPCGFQELYLRRGGGDTVFLMDDAKTLGYYGARSGMEIHIKDLDPHSLSLHGGLEDVSQVEKYVMPDEEYDKMKNSVRAIKREREAQKRAEEAARSAAGEDGEGLEGDIYETKAAPVIKNELTAEELAAAYPIGSRCEVTPGGRRGVIKFAGSIQGTKTKGPWIGICLDEPLGQNDGSKDGHQYFECPGPKYGAFSKPENVLVGDYPERDPFASDDEF
jgi:tubulin-folding cofactor B